MIFRLAAREWIVRHAYTSLSSPAPRRLLCGRSDRGGPPRRGIPTSRREALSARPAATRRDTPGIISTADEARAGAGRARDASPAAQVPAAQRMKFAAALPIAMNGLAFNLSTPHGRMMATTIAGIAEFERELIPGAHPLRHRRREGARQAPGAPAQGARNPTRLAPKVLALVAR
jgi:hypothetical protein